jgi:hypothetical protein
MISDLLSVLKEGARNNKYRVTVPNLLGDGGRTLDLLSTSASLPSKTITPVEVYIKGRKVQIRGETNLQNTWTVTFYNDTKMRERNNIIRWMNQIHSNKWDANISNLQRAMAGFEGIIRGVKNVLNNPLSLLNSQASYSSDIIIEQLDANGDSVYTVTLVGAFPVEVSPVDFVAENGNVSTTTVTFAFTDIETDTKGFGLEDISRVIGSL